MGWLMLPCVNDSPNYQGDKVIANTHFMKNYTNRNAVKFVLDDITRNRANEKYEYQLLGYGALGVNHFLIVEDMIKTFNYVQQAYDIEQRGGRRIYHEVFWFSEEELALMNGDIQQMWNFAYEVSREFFYKRGHQVIFAIHYDFQGKFHVHFAVNTVNYITGLKLQTFKKDIKEREECCNVILEKYLCPINLIKIRKPFYFGIYKGECEK